MTLRHIRIFLAVCDHDCNVTRAAQALYMAQPAVSAAIRELEEEYGVRLFDRISRRFPLRKRDGGFISMPARWMPCMETWTGKCGDGIPGDCCGLDAASRWAPG